MKVAMNHSWLAKRSTALVAGLALVFVPTLFSVFPTWGTWSPLVRVVIVAAWLGAAAIVVAGTARQGEQVDDLLGTATSRRDEARAAAGPALLRAILRPEEAGFPSDCEFRLFLPNAEKTALLPEYESAENTPSEGWKPGQGATGAAWARNAYIRLIGKAVSDGTYGLTPEQQARYGDLRAVAATPVLNARFNPIGVLTVSTTSEDPFIESDEAVLRHIDLAEVVARILIDVFRRTGD